MSVRSEESSAANVVLCLIIGIALAAAMVHWWST